MEKDKLLWLLVLMALGFIICISPTLPINVSYNPVDKTAKVQVPQVPNQAPTMNVLPLSSELFAC